MSKRRTVKKVPMPEGLREYFRQEGARGGRIGGKRRAANLTAEQRRESARRAARARWAKEKRKDAK